MNDADKIILDENYGNRSMVSILISIDYHYELF